MTVFMVPNVAPLRNMVPISTFSYHVPNGVWIPGNPRTSAIIIAKLKEQGFKPGISDIVIAYPVHGYHGAYIELKRGPKENPTEEQADWLGLMKRAGYFAYVARGLDDAMAAIRRYISGVDVVAKRAGRVLQSAPREET